MLYVMRHGKTDWNAGFRLQGRTDIPLNDDGRKMAEEAAARYRGVHFDVCFCSPLRRAAETAEILFRDRADVPVIPDARLSEMSFGVCEGLENCYERTDSPISKFFLRPEEYVVPAEGGESFEELFARTGEFLNEVVLPLLREGKDVLIVGHGAMNNSIICRTMGLPLKDFWSLGIENCKMFRLPEFTEPLRYDVAEQRRSAKN